MWGSPSKLQRETVALLRQLHEALRNDIAVRQEIAKGLASGDHQHRMQTIKEESEARRREMEVRMEESKKQREHERQEDREYRQRLLAALDQLTDVVSRVAAKLEQLHPHQP